MQISTRHIIALVIAATLIFLLAASFLLLYVGLYNKRKRRHIEETLFLKRQFEDELLKAQMEVQEQTIQTIASDIHDNIGQLLSITKLTLSTVDISNHPGNARKKIDHSLELLNKSIQELRQMASVLHAQNLLAEGLENAIDNELRWLSKSERYKVTWSTAGQKQLNINSQRELIAFRLIQEILNNIIKHANATEITVKLIYEPEATSIMLEDNGVGFNVSHLVSNPVGLGLHNLYNRAKMIGGDLKIESQIGRGTTAIIRIFDGQNKISL